MFFNIDFGLLYGQRFYALHIRRIFCKRSSTSLALYLIGEKSQGKM